MITLRYQSVNRKGRTTINRTAHTYKGALAMIESELVKQTKQGLDQDTVAALVTPTQPFKKDTDRESITLSFVTA